MSIHDSQLTLILHFHLPCISPLLYCQVTMRWSGLNNKKMTCLRMHHDTGLSELSHLSYLVRSMPVRFWIHQFFECISNWPLKQAHSSILSTHFILYIFLVLFQMALIPFTMSRYTIASLSNSKLNDYLPLNKSMSIHIYLGYTMVCFSIMATVMVSFFFFL